jgi:quercetin dioxygenase-like cupin family protein
MNQADFEQAARTDGFTEFFDRQREAGEPSPEHSHEFDARLFVLKGEMTIACNGAPRTFRAGEICSVPAGTPHTEQFGAGTEGVHFIAAWRYPAPAVR